MRRKKRFLCICQGGNVRSTGLAFLIRHGGYEQEALAASAEKNTEATLRMLYRWADYVVVMSAEIMTFLPESLRRHPKVCLVDVGPDRFGTPFHPELQRMLVPVLDEWRRRKWDIHNAGDEGVAHA